LKMRRQTGSASAAALDRRIVRTTATRRRDHRPQAADAAPLGERFFRHLVFNLRNGVLAITRNGEVAAMNDIAYRVLGLRPQSDDLGQPFTQVLHDCPEVTRVLQQAFESDDLPNRAEMRLRKTRRAIGYTLSRIYDDAGVLLGATLFFKDLTRVEQMEERDRLRDRLAALGEMAAAIAHEVKNPLASIEVMAGVLKRQLAEQPDALETLDDIIKEAKMANAIVVEVLEFVRPIQLQVERVSLADVLKDSITLAEGKRRRGAVSIDTDVAPDVPDLLADSHQLRQLFSNLLANAFEALGGEGHVHLGASLVAVDEDLSPGGEAAAPQVAIEVRDSGPGIAADDLERIFSPFFTTKPQGTGLGLAIVRKVVDAHDGRIDAVSAPGRGATFRVTLPVVPSIRSMGR
ncbi:MAG TPA: ATP-binding protein, partial [Vicinamibacterales bacterium]|nr:ATP-binding protein [Vicinamibacterales bacterium]